MEGKTISHYGSVKWYTEKKNIVNGQCTKPWSSVLQNMQNFLHQKGLWCWFEDPQQNCSFTNHSNRVYLNIEIGCPFKLSASMGSCLHLSSAGIYIPIACSEQAAQATSCFSSWVAQRWDHQCRHINTTELKILKESRWFEHLLVKNVRKQTVGKGIKKRIIHQILILLYIRSPSHL